MPRLELPLIGLLEDSILPGEERSFVAPVLDAAALGALSRALASGQATLFALASASPVELPSLVSARWGTECEVLAADGASLTLRGLRRGRLVTARGKEAPYRAEVEVPAEGADAADAKELIHAAHALLAALDAGALPDLAPHADALRPALLAVGRAVTGKDMLLDLGAMPPLEALRKLAAILAARAPGEEASCALEAAAREMMGKPELPKPLRHRLWAQVVEIQKRLDVYDPTVPEEGDDVARLQRRLMQAGLHKAARETAKRELRLLRGMQSNHHDYSTYVAHLDFMARLPWQPDPAKPIDLDAVQAALDRGHFGLEKAKRRVLEFLAVRALGGENASMILCLSGPPGVGKTSIAHAMAEALGRPFVRVPLGGVHDESEIRGHRTSFVAAAAGRILKGIAQAGSASALVLLDEIDKIGSDTQRSPMAALLEVLDPEQNKEFQDNYLGVTYDLSHVLFVATANETARIHPTLLDRMEPVEIDGYTENEKSAIARGHQMERLRAEHGLPAAPAIEDDALSLVIEGHTRESGVRQMRRALAAIFRARALEIVRAKDRPIEAAPRPITAAEVTEVLGPRRYPSQRVDEALPVGVATGLSVGPGGGSLLLIEVGLMPGKGELSLTGRVGEVLGESVRAALSHLRVAPERYGIAADRLSTLDVHLHLPEAAIPKDGPSAGTAIFAALVSALTGAAVPADLALTGEISLTGRVLPVGGVRPKLLAAERAGVKRVIVPEDNRADVPKDVALEVVMVRSLAEVMRAVFGARS
jgi:ATP-dependent Lon protease